MHVYAIPPIDMGWENLTSVEETAVKIAAVEARASAQGLDAGLPVGLAGFLGAWARAKDLARDAGWEGDFRQPAVVFWLPDEESFTPAFVIKQDNNGTTFVVSPFPLPHLDRFR